MKAGRKRSFDKAEALEKATRLFWANGYPGTSVRDLSATLGINKPSLYAAFGNKEQLFKASLHHYQRCYGEPHFEKLLKAPDSPLRERVRTYMQSIAKQVTDPSLPSGCLLVKSSCEAGSEAIPEEIGQALHDMKQNNEDRLVAFFTAEQHRGLLAVNVDIDRLAHFILSVLYGIGVMASNGANQERLNSVIDLALDILTCGAVDTTSAARRNP